MLPFTRPSIGEAEARAVSDVLASGWVTSGPQVKAFEAAVADYIGGDGRVLAVSSGTAALEAALLAAGIGPGDEVIVPAMSFAASANAVVRTGATVVFGDVDLATRNLTAAAVENGLTNRTRAVMPVHFAGLPVELEKIWSVANRCGLRVIEDAAHAMGSRYKDVPIGACGDFVCFSYHPNKNMTTIEGGAIVCFDEGDARRIEALRFHGIEKDARGDIEIAEWGGKMNLPDVNAAVGLAQLPRLDGWIERRRALALSYRERMPAHPALHLPPDAPGHSWNMFNVRVDFKAIGTDRHDFQAALRERGVETGTHFPAIHLFDLYRRLGGKPGDHPNAELIGRQTLTLPMYPAMSDADVDTVSGAFADLLPVISGRPGRGELNTMGA